MDNEKNILDDYRMEEIVRKKKGIKVIKKNTLSLNIMYMEFIYIYILKKRENNQRKLIFQRMKMELEHRRSDTWNFFALLRANYSPLNYPTPKTEPR